MADDVNAASELDFLETIRKRVADAARAVRIPRQVQNDDVEIRNFIAEKTEI